MLIENVKSEESLSVKLHHSVNLECKIKSSPEPLTYWSLVSNIIYAFILSKASKYLLPFTI